MNKLLVYSHDTFGMGNIRRMLAISEYLLEQDEQLSILLVTGSAVVHSLRLPKRLDYIKLPSLTRTASNVYSAKTLGTDIEEMIRLRSDLIFAAAEHFSPDVVLIDKKPYGVKQELTKTLKYLGLRTNARIGLVLRDILDSPDRTIPVWHEGEYTESIESYYDNVLVLGTPDIFDPRVQYRWPAAVCRKTLFCGYLGKPRCFGSRSVIRQELGIAPEEKLVLVTPGGGEDAYPVLEAYCSAVAQNQLAPSVKSLVVTGPELPEWQRQRITSAIGKSARVKSWTFVDNMMAYMEAADLVICMGGYNTICEVLSVGKPAVVIPRVEPVEEQWMRAQKLVGNRQFCVIHPRELTPTHLASVVTRQLDECGRSQQVLRLNLNGLRNVSEWTRQMFIDVNGMLEAGTQLRDDFAINF